MAGSGAKPLGVPALGAFLPIWKDKTKSPRSGAPMRG